ncbi:hypothetical protein B5G06_12245 [Flavonifractor sp. An52]|uniref:glycosyltransferase family 2 protein n=1 Tax=Flavonifractor sp. An52 TaxID=1965642 RepID=UPI000B39BA7B|nr:glycosyltransferase [Flavonifractor sp. An52]OUN79910.1 hypothetical protein B5G06_12245 [Flavonifractor sp. An52]
MKISVIVPIYNVEKYLRRCINSIISQSYNNLQIILVDDGSSDNCGRICDIYAAQDARIQVIHKKNGGLSDARNAGLELANGEWISFVDSDDWIEPDMYSDLLQNAKKYGAQISVGGVNDEVIQDGAIKIVKSTFRGVQEIECLGPVDAMRRHLLGSWAAWDKIYRREIFTGIRFPVGEINEDEPIMLELLSRCAKITYTNKVYYHYIQRVQSITTSLFSEKKLVWPKHCRDNLTFVQEKYPELKLIAAARYRSSILWALREIALSGEDYTVQRQELLKQLREYYSLFRNAPFEYYTDRIRLMLLRWLPFCCFKALIRGRSK